jgi:O-antigen ligase
VHTYFEKGLVGLALFGALMLAALGTTARASASEPLAFATFLALTGFLAVGSFGTLVDAPRIGFLFWFLTLVGLGLARRRGSAAAPVATSPGAGRRLPAREPGRGRHASVFPRHPRSRSGLS